MVTKKECWEKSPWHICGLNNGGKEIIFRKGGKNLFTAKLDKDNVVKLAFDLLEPFDYDPKMENVNVSRCQS